MDDRTSGLVTGGGDGTVRQWKESTLQKRARKAPSPVTGSVYGQTGGLADFPEHNSRTEHPPPPPPRSVSAD